MDIKKFEAFLVAHNKTHVIFDFDETIFWLVLPWHTFIDVAKIALEPFDKKIFQMYTKGEISYSVMQNMYVASFGDQTLATIRNIITNFEFNSPANIKPNPDLIKFIRTSSTSFNFYIWSSNTSRIINKILKQHRLDKIFIKIASRSELSYVKPEPDGFYYLHKKGVDKKHYVMVGNSIADKQAAEAAGVDFFHIDYFTKLPQAD